MKSNTYKQVILARSKILTGCKSELKRHKEYLVSELCRYIELKKAGGRKARSPKITISIPGATTYTLNNDQETLSRILRRVRSNYWTQLPNGSEEPRALPLGPSRPASLGNPRNMDEIRKFAGKACKTCKTPDPNHPLNLVLLQGDSVIATDGHRMVVVATQAGGGGEGRSFWNPNTAKDHAPDQLTKAWPEWQHVIPKETTTVAVNVPTCDFSKLLFQAEAAADESTTRAHLWANADGSIGVETEMDESGAFQGNIQPERKYVGLFNTKFLQEGMWIARKLGHEAVVLETGMAPTTTPDPGVALLIVGKSPGATPFTYLLLQIAGPKPFEEPRSVTPVHHS